MKKESETFSFVQISENETSNDVILSLVSFKLTNCNNSTPPIAYDKTVWKNGHQESMLLKIDPQEKYAYVFADSFMLSYDLSTKNVAIYEFNQNIIPIAFDLTNEWAFLIGYTPSIRGDFGHPYLYVINLLSKTWSTCNDSNETFLPLMSTQNIYSRDHGVSISINPSGKFIAIGISAINRVQIFETSHIRNCSFKSIDNIQSVHFLDMMGIGFGQSVAWLDNQGLLAVLVYNPKHQLQPESEIHVFQTLTQNNEMQHVLPNFIFPNNQQTLPKNWTSKSFLLILARSNNLLILCDRHKYLYIPLTNAGSRPILYDERPKIAFVLQPKPCVSGTYKNISSIGPCTVCPSGTKNSGNYPAIICQPCNSKSFCPLGASGNIRYNDFLLYKSYNQTFKYPESPLIDDYDDMLMRNFLVVEETMDCVFKLPLVWTLIAIVMSFIIWFIMFLIKRWQLNSVDIHRNRAKAFFKQIDIIGEGELLVGGLASFVVLTIIIHSCWFAHDYLHSYPLEEVNSSRLHCRNNQVNTKFDNALQLPLPETDGTYETIFDMLNKQKFTMTIDLINTGAKCANITVERLRYMGAAESIIKQNCTLLDRNVTGSFSFDLSTHTDFVQVTIQGPYFIGALRICLHGEKGLDEVQEQKRHQLDELDVCTLFYKENQTIGLSTYFSINLIKVINVTEPLTATDDTYYTGRWAPNIRYVDDLSDRDYFKKDGQHLRYASLSTTFKIRLKEEFYFLLNNQSPIVRLYELIFHTFLFIFLIIDIFAMGFVVYKLWCQPLLRRLLSARHNILRRKLQLNHTETMADPSSQRQLSMKDTNAPSSNDLEMNLTTQAASTTIKQSKLSSSELSDQSSLLVTNSLFEYFDKRFETMTQNIEHIANDVNTMRKQIDELIPDVIHLKQHMADIKKTT
ncbi:unnamed protein product [Adineta steineri]|uniref:Uncharacterized protein n=1 Tax=Adineta steineri TaxID=433720 RepID=A0A819CS19_9BILA|nr:unnamed protein product [Adineta steineri]